MRITHELERGTADFEFDTYLTTVNGRDAVAYDVFGLVIDGDRWLIEQLRQDEQDELADVIERHLNELY